MMTIRLALALAMVVACAGLAVAEPHEHWEARPPVHIRQDATSAPSGYNPAQVRKAYGFTAVNADGHGQIIAIVSAYDAPTIESDLKTFNTYFKLPAMNVTCTVTAGPHPCFQKVFA